MSDYKKIIDFIKNQFPSQEFIPLHEPRFMGKEKDYVADAIDSTFVSSVGSYVNKFEEKMAEITGTKFAVATVNGTSALHMSLLISGVERDDEVITQPLTFIATTNAIAYIGARPVFIDVDLDTMGLSPKALKSFLEEETYKKGEYTYNKKTNKRITDLNLLFN